MTERATGGGGWGTVDRSDRLRSPLDVLPVIVVLALFYLLTGLLANIIINPALVKHTVRDTEGPVRGTLPVNHCDDRRSNGSTGRAVPNR
jgi:hypothetical protein